jgi:pimeloyl-ACP methyl ester carboxylesterase
MTRWIPLPVAALVVVSLSYGSAPVYRFGEPVPGLRAEVPVGPDSMIVSEEVSFVVGSRTIPGTLTRPAKGTGPGLLLLAGSGPTDRNWNSPLLQGTNGSARQLAEALAGRGIVSLRFDKAFSGQNRSLPITELTLDTYVAEARAALALLRSRPEVDPSRVFIAGHSEGGIHVTRLALAEGHAVRGVILLSAPARPMKDLLLSQIESGFRDDAKLAPEEVEARMKPIRQGLADFLAGKDVDPQAVSDSPQIRMIFMSLTAKPVAALGRALISFDPEAEAAKIEVPVLVLQGGKDIQVDLGEAQRLVSALRGAKRDVSYHLSPDASHVLKHELKAIPDLLANRAAVQATYSADGIPIDEDVVAALTAWIRGKS